FICNSQRNCSCVAIGECYETTGIGPAVGPDFKSLRAVRTAPFFFSSRRRHTRSVSAFLLNRSSDLHVLVGCGLLMLKVSRLKLPVIWLLVSMWLNTLTKSQIWTLLLKV